MSDQPDKSHGPAGEDSPLNMIWVSMTGASVGHDESSPPGIDENSQRVGHEPDEFNIRGILAVPAAVIVTLVLTYLIVSGIFAYVKPPQAHLAAQGQKPVNERIGRISSTDPHAVEGRPTTAVPQPRLEQIRQIDDKRSGESQADPPYLRSFPDAPGGNNSPEIYPQSLYPENFVDPTSGRKALSESEWVAKDKGIAQIPIGDSIKLLTTTKKPASKAGGATPVAGTVGQAKLSTGGRGGPSEPKTAPKPEHDHHH